MVRAPAARVGETALVGARYDDVLADIRAAYGAKVEERAGGAIQPWKEAEQAAFVHRLRAEGRRTVLEVGAGTGRHGRVFADEGFDVICTDPSPEMVAHCRSQGLTADEQDVLHLAVAEPVDAAFAMNCLLHVPLGDVPAALRAVERCLVPGGLFFWGQYGGVRREGRFDGDNYEPKRFFSSWADDEIEAVATEVFDLVDFHPVDVSGDRTDPFRFQSLTLRSRPA